MDEMKLARHKEYTQLLMVRNFLLLPNVEQEIIVKLSQEIHVLSIEN